MGRLGRAGAGLVVALGVAAGPGAAADAAAPIRCTLHLQTLAPPGATAGEDFGTVSCAGFFGRGVQRDVFAITPTTPTSGSERATFKAFFDRGTVHGTLRATFAVTAAGVVKLSATGRIAGGTGAFQHVRGAARVVCTSPDGGTHSSCAETAVLSHR